MQMMRILLHSTSPTFVHLEFARLHEDLGQATETAVPSTGVEGAFRTGPPVVGEDKEERRFRWPRGYTGLLWSTELVRNVFK